MGRACFLLRRVSKVRKKEDQQSEQILSSLSDPLWSQTYFRSPCGLSLSSIPLTETKNYLLFSKTAFSFQLEHQSRWIRKQQQQVLQQWWWFDWSRLQMGLQLDCFQYIVLKIWRYLPFRDSTYCRRSRQRQHFPFTLPKTLKGDSTLLLSIFLLLSSSLLGYLWNTVRPNSIPRSLLSKCFLSEPLRAQSRNFLVHHPTFQIRYTVPVDHQPTRKRRKKSFYINVSEITDRRNQKDHRDRREIGQRDVKLLREKSGEMGRDLEVKLEEVVIIWHQKQMRVHDIIEMEEGTML